MTTPQEIEPMRSLIIKPTTSNSGVRGEIAVGRGPNDTINTFWLPAGVHQIIIDFKEDRWMSLYYKSRALIGKDGPFNGQMVRVVMDEPGQIVPFISTADPAKPIYAGVTIFQVPA